MNQAHNTTFPPIPPLAHPPFYPLLPIIPLLSFAHTQLKPHQTQHLSTFPFLHFSTFPLAFFDFQFRGFSFRPLFHAFSCFCFWALLASAPPAPILSNFFDFFFLPHPPAFLFLPLPVLPHLPAFIPPCLFSPFFLRVPSRLVSSGVRLLLPHLISSHRALCLPPPPQAYISIPQSNSNFRRLPLAFVRLFVWSVVRSSWRFVMCGVVNVT